ncbi:short chain dehydrogenase [Xylariomycetidae sp. FL0641]|nr:short chain dehydrogenase [Xylariomycetidae sp. FL0641]
MGRIFITGSSDGLGLLAAKQLETKALATTVTEKLGGGGVDGGGEPRLDCVFHNAGLYLPGAVPYRAQGEGYPAAFAVNVLAPYLLTCLQRGAQGRFSPAGLYADTKLYNTMFGYALAAPLRHRRPRRRPRLGPHQDGRRRGPGRRRRLYVMLAEGSGGEAAGRNGGFWENGQRGPARSKQDAYDEAAQEALLRKLEEVTGVALPD